MPSIRRVLDVSIASAALVALLPVLAIAAIGIKLTSPGPVFYRARRVARDRRRWPAIASSLAAVPERRQARGYRGREFVLYKFRTMRVATGDVGDPITAWKDARVFPFGAWLRDTKIDELPQLLNVIKGEMALVGPRPEAPEIVRQHYTTSDLATLLVLPGVTSPGTIYYFMHSDQILAGDSIVDTYVKRLLPLKLELDRVYIRDATALSDLGILVRTTAVIVAKILGNRRFSDPPELAEANAMVAARTSRASHPEVPDLR
jgi:lipopolysaccharide/colanic/teichoic acid biosynthesis glycosyltransferase